MNSTIGCIEQMRLNYPPDLHLECIKCGLCCRDTGSHRRKIILTPKDIDNIVKVTHQSRRDFCRATHAAPKPFSHIMKKTSGSCLFLDGDSTCTIYDSRPLICRSYPFAVEYEDNNVISFTTSSKDCPGLGRGRRVPREFFEKLAKEVTSNFKYCER